MTEDNYDIVILQQDPTESYKQDWLRMINAFKADYFQHQAGHSRLSRRAMEHGLENQKGLFNFMLYKNTICIAIAEVAVGSLWKHRTMGVATVYVKPNYRGKGIANDLYQEIERIAKENDCLFNMHIEQDSLDKNRDKFIEMGFVTYEPIREFTNGNGYAQQTYALFTDYHYKRMKPLGNYKPGMQVEMGIRLHND